MSRSDLDFSVSNQGSIVLFTPLSESAQDFSEEAFASAMTFGGAYVVEPRFAGPIVEDLIENDFTLEM